VSSGTEVVSPCAHRSRRARPTRTTWARPSPITEAIPRRAYVCRFHGRCSTARRFCGTVTNAFTDEAEAEVLVILHADTDTQDSTVGRGTSRGRKATSSWATCVRGDTTCMRCGPNFRKDLPNERLAFSDALLTLTTASDTYCACSCHWPPPTGEGGDGATRPRLAVVLARPADSLRSHPSTGPAEN
jgi:hypothetical protein